MARFEEVARGVESCAARELTIARLMIATVKRNFMRILAPRCDREWVIVRLRWLVVKLPDVMAGRLRSCGRERRLHTHAYLVSRARAAGIHVGDSSGVTGNSDGTPVTTPDH
jgi:hypothetical protein